MLRSPRPAEPADRCPPARLPEMVRDHLGRGLRDLYREHSTRDLSPDLAALLSRLTKALAAQSDSDAHAFEAGMMEAVRSLRAFAISLSGSAVEADDLVQETLLRAWKNRLMFTPGTNLDAWLF